MEYIGAAPVRKNARLASADREGAFATLISLSGAGFPRPARAAVSLELLSLTALSPLDGRYGRQTAELRDVFSEFAFMRERLRVEIEWLIALSSIGLPELPPLAEPLKADLRQLVAHFSIEDCTEIKAIEAETNHDVKAVEYFIKARTGRGARQGGRVHPLRLHVRGHQQRLARADARARPLRAAGPPARDPRAAARIRARPYADLPMLSRTHGQPATPTTVGKEFANVAVRLGNAIDGSRACRCSPR